MGSVPQNNAPVELPLPPIHPAAGQLMAGLERPNVLLMVAGGLRVQRTDRWATRFRVPPKLGRSVQIMNFRRGRAESQSA